MSSSVRQLRAIMYKEIIDITKNKALILINILFPIMSIIFSQVLGGKEIKEIMPMIILFHTTMAPMISIASIIGDEKEKYTLRYLILTGIQPETYLVAIGVIICGISTLTSSIFILQLNVDAMVKLLNFYIVSVSEIVISSIIGATIGLIIKNQLSVGVLAAPVGMILSFIPFAGEINTKIGYIAKYVFSNVNYCILNKLEYRCSISDYKYYFVNLCFFILLFRLSFKKRGLNLSE